jgi:hypothetical protein
METSRNDMLVWRERGSVRITVKVIGIFSALFGVLLLSLFPFTLGNAIRTSDNGAALASGIMVVLGLGFIFAGRHFFHADPSVEDPIPPASNFSRYLTRHRRDLKMIAQIGFALSVIRLVTACFDSDWPAPQTTWFLLIGGVLLDYCGRKAADPAVTDNRDWMHVPLWIRRVLETGSTAISIVWIGAVFLAIYRQSYPPGIQISPFVTRIALDAMLIFMYARTALFFAYGELQPLQPRLST